MTHPKSPPTAVDFAAVLEDQALPPLELPPLGSGGEAGSRLLPVSGAPTPALRERWLGAAEVELDEQGALFLMLPESAGDQTLAAWRNALWPLLHATTAYHSRSGRLVRTTAGGARELALESDLCCRLLLLRRREFAMSPDATIHKFDQNEEGWNGRPDSPGYPHFRWMRRYVATFGHLPAGPARILDFGCGAGWVGIEAALRVDQPTLRAFDPSPQMIEIAASNAARSGIGDFEGRTGFGEQPPFPGPGEPPFDLVLSSGVISFSPDTERWLDGLSRAVAPGGSLVIGDIHRDARGMRRRRRLKPVLPTREMNALRREDVRAALEARGFRHCRSAAYQLTRPIPELMHLSETRLGGSLSRPLLWLNRLGAALDRGLGSPFPDHFDSWVMHFRKPASSDPAD